MQNVNEQYIQKGGILGKLSIFTKWLYGYALNLNPPATGVIKLTILVDPSLVIITLLSVYLIYGQESRGRFFCFVCLFVCLEFIVPLENFLLIWSTIAGEGLQILTYARHSWQLSSEQILTYMYA